MYIRAFITADNRRDRLDVAKDGTYTISVRAPARGNAANARALALVASEFGVSTMQVHIVSGHQRRSKIIRIDT